MYSKLALIAVLAGTVAAFAPTTFIARQSTAVFNVGPGHIGAGGMADTRDPDAFEHEDPRKSIKAAPSFEEYLKQRSGGGDAPAAAPSSGPPADAFAAAAAPAPAPVAPAAPAPEAPKSSSVGPGHIGAGGMADTRDPEAYEDEDPRKSIKAAPSFEEYLKQRQG